MFSTFFDERSDMKLLNQLIEPGAEVYYSAEFRNVLEDHMTYLREHSENSVQSIEPNIAYKYIGDLTGVLHHYRVPYHLHWVVMRMNNMTSPVDYRDTMLSLIIPSFSAVDKIRAAHKTQSKLKK